MLLRVTGRRAKEGKECPVCGGSVPPSLGIRPRIYCSAKCRDHAGYARKVAEDDKRCSVCQKQILATRKRGNGDGRRCDDCRKAAMARACGRCGEPFSCAGKAKYCSVECSRKPPKCNMCRECGTQFSCGQKKFCSEACRAKAAVKRGEKTAERNRARAKRHCCQNCGTQFVAKNRSRCSFKFCSRDCAFEARRLKKKCAARPLEVAGKLAKWFLSWGDDYWPHAAVCDCGKRFIAQLNESAGVRDCCPACRERKAKRPDGDCGDCGATIAAGRKYCDACSASRHAAGRRKHRKKSREKHGSASTFRQRCKKYGCPYTKVSKQAVMERDDWKCRLCGHRLLDKFTTVMGTRTPHPRCPTIDHIVPLSFGPSSPG